jgi:hypothetical protein
MELIGFAMANNLHYLKCFFCTCGGIKWWQAEIELSTSICLQTPNISIEIPWVQFIISEPKRKKKKKRGIRLTNDDYTYKSFISQSLDERRPNRNSTQLGDRGIPRIWIMQTVSDSQWNIRIEPQMLLAHAPYHICSKFGKEFASLKTILNAGVPKISLTLIVRGLHLFWR